MTLVDGVYREEDIIVEETPESWRSKGPPKGAAAGQGGGFMDSSPGTTQGGGGGGGSSIRGAPPKMRQVSSSRGERPPRRKLVLVNMDKRLEAAQRNMGAMHLQRLWRGRQGRIWAAAFIPWHAARDMQRVMRGHLGRKRFDAAFVAFHQVSH